MFPSTQHGGDKKTNNMYACDDAGNLLTHKVLHIKSHDLSELRGFCFKNGYLYVASSGKQVDDICCLEGMGTAHTAGSPFLNGGSIASIDHPFDLVFFAGGVSVCRLVAFAPPMQKPECSAKVPSAS